MARRPRLQFPGAVYHVNSRGVRRLPIFTDDHDRRHFMMLVGEAARLYVVTVYAGCLMTNHYHFVLETPRGNLSDAMQFINGRYSQDSNRRHGRSGHSFEERFHAELVQRERYLRHAARYVVRNPVRGGLVSEVSAWPWSTYRATAGLEAAPAWLNTDWIEWAFSASTKEEAQKKYQLYVNRPAARRDRLNSNGIAMGSAAFKRVIAEIAKGDESDRELPTTCVPPDRPSLETLFADRHATGSGRDQTIYTAHVLHGYRCSEIGAWLGLHRSNVSRAARRFMHGI